MTARKLGLVTAAALVVANIIGTGIFTSTGFQAQSLHDGGTILLAWVVGGLLALAGAASYGELGAMMPRAGGEYVYLREAYHPVVGVMSGWVSLLAGFSAPVAVSALAFSHYLGVVWPSVAGPDASRVVAVALVLSMTAMHAFDTVIGGRVQAGFTIAKVVLIAVFIAAGLASGAGDWSHFSARAGGLDNAATESFAVALYYVMFAYSGWNAAAYIASDIDKPQRNLPRALLIGTALVMGLYLLANVTFLYALSPETLAGPGGDAPPVIEVGAASAQALLGRTAGDLIASLIALALVSSVSAMIMAGPRVYSAMAGDGALPRVLAHHTRRGVPAVAVAVQGLVACAFVLVGDLGKLMRYIGFTLSIFAALAVAAVFVLRRSRPDVPRPYKTMLYPITPLVFVGISAWAAYFQIKSRPADAAWGAATIAIGALVYLLTGRGTRGSVLPPRPGAELPVATARDADPDA